MNIDMYFLQQIKLLKNIIPELYKNDQQICVYIFYRYRSMLYAISHFHVLFFEKFYIFSIMKIKGNLGIINFN